MLAPLALATVALADTNLGSSGGVNYRSDAKAVPNGGTAKMKVRCKGGKEISGGGFGSAVLFAHARQITPYDGKDSDKRPDDGLMVRAVGDAGADDVSAYAICANHHPSFPRDSKKISAGKAGRATAKCPQGARVTGGGGTAPGNVITGSHPVDLGDRDERPDDGWRVRGFAATAMKLKAIAICSPGATAYRTSSVSVGPGTSTPVSPLPECPDAKHVVGIGGAITGNQSEVRFNAARSADGGDANAVPDDRVLVNFGNQASTPAKTATAFAICR
jgi:hypothetical protein